MTNSLLHLFNPVQVLRNLWKYRDLIKELTLREIRQQYQGSYLGFVWSLIVPLMMLLIYTFVFSTVFKARWPDAGENATPQDFSLILFAGLTPFNLFSGVINRSATMIVSVPNYVKKVIFPLEILPVVAVASGLFTSFIYVGLIIIGKLIFSQQISLTLFLLLLAYLPLIFMTLGLSWFLSSLGVYIRDIGQGVGVVVQVLFFMTPIFYPVSAVPDNLRLFLAINPLGEIVNEFRRTLLWNQMLPWPTWGILTLGTAFFALLGYVWFIKTKKGFADVL